jgi:hypothetical protein
MVTDVGGHGGKYGTDGKGATVSETVIQKAEMGNASNPLVRCAVFPLEVSQHRL